MKPAIVLYSALLVIAAACAPHNPNGDKNDNGTYDTDTNETNNRPPIEVTTGVTPNPNIEEYKPTLIKGDTIKIHVIDEELLSLTVQVDPRGAIEYPLLGTIEVEGYTTWEVKDIITKKLQADYIKSPQVFVDIVNYAARRVYIQGGVMKAGEYTMELGERLTLYQLILNAGGFKPEAKKDSVMLLRMGKDMKREITYLSFDKVDQGTLSNDPILLPNDIVIVPISAKSYYIWGAVTNTGLFTMKPNERLTLMKAVIISGGFTKFAAPHKVQVMRPDTTQKKYKTFTVNVEAIISGESQDDFEIMANDIIYVPESLF